MLPILCAIFFLSGAAALVFETLWFRQAGLTFGNGVWASSLVLSSFMAGLALGNGLAARLAERVRRPLVCFMALELAIAVSGVLLVWGLPQLTGALAPLLGPWVDLPWLVNPLRFALAFLLLLVPATAMGASLPVLVKAWTDLDPSFGPGLARLYGWNTLGAFSGALAGELFLVGWLGVTGSAAVAGGLDLVAALGAIWLWQRMPVAAHDPPLAAAPPASRRLLAAAFLSGAVMLAFEVIGFRFLLLFVDSGKVSHRYASLVVLASSALLSLAYAGFGFAQAPLGDRDAVGIAEIAYLALVLMGSTAFASGLLFPLVGAALHERSGAATRSAGLLTLYNTLGAGLGSLAAGFVMLPVLGVERSLFVLLLVQGATAALLCPPLAWTTQRRVLVGCTAGFALVLLGFPFGAMQQRTLPEIAARYDRGGRMSLVATREGTSETLMYLRRDFLGEAHQFQLVTNSTAMSGTAVQARRYMKLYAYLPVALHPGIEDALLISYGVGSTARALTDTRSIQRIEVVDVSRDILEMSDLVYPDPHEHPLRDSRVSVHVEDGRYFLETTSRRFDLITGEPPPPKAAGIVYLYTQEYFELVRERLREGGIHTYWLPVHGLQAADTLAIVRSYCEVFPDCSLWTGSGLDWMLVGSRDGSFRPSEEHFTRQWQDPRVEEELRSVGFERPEQLGAVFLADADTLRELSADTPPLVDDFPKRLSRRTPLTAETQHFYRRIMDSQAARERFASSAFVRSQWPPALRQATLDYFEFQAAINRLTLPSGWVPEPRVREQQLYALLSRSPLETLVLWSMHVDRDLLRILERRLAQGMPPDVHPLLQAADALASRDYAQAERVLDLASRLDPDDESYRYLRLFALCMANRVQEARALAQPLLVAAGPGAEAAPYWTWLRETFGLLPNATTPP
jgi:spermidine synthase